MLLLTLRWRRGPAYFAHESLCNCSVVEVFQPVVVAGLLDLAGATCILAFAWLARLWRSGPAAFAHKFARACSLVEVLLPVLFTRLVEFTTSAFVLMRTLPSGLSVQSRIGCLEITAFTTQTLPVGRHTSSWRGMNYAPRLRFRGIQRGMDPKGMRHGSTLTVGKDTNTITSSFANVIGRECERQLDGVV